MILTISTAAVGFILHEQKGNTGQHIWSLLAFVTAIGVTFLSWNIQKAKAIRRFDALSRGDICTFERQDLIRNQVIDWFAAFVLFVGILCEACARFLPYVCFPPQGS